MEAQRREIFCRCLAEITMVLYLCLIPERADEHDEPINAISVEIFLFEAVLTKKLSHS